MFFPKSPSLEYILPESRPVLPSAACIIDAYVDSRELFGRSCVARAVSRLLATYSIITLQCGDISLTVGTSPHQSAVLAVAQGKGERCRLGCVADVADLVALLLHGHVKQILLLHGVALAFVVTGGVGPIGLLLRGVMECFAHDGSDTPPITRKDLLPTEEGAVYHAHNVQESPGGEKEMGTMNPVIVSDRTGDMTVSTHF